jgi:RNA polymerase sigma-70 factor, ECF subfamily
MDAESAPACEHYGQVLRFARRRAASAADAEDVTQEVFLELAAKLAGSASTGSPTLGLLYTVARRRLVDQARRRRRSSVVPLEAAAEPATAHSEYGHAVARAINAALAALDADQRSVVLGRLIRGASFAELAAELEISEAACRMRFMRGLARLRTRLEKEGWKP